MALKFAARKVLELPIDTCVLAIRYSDFLDYTTDLSGRTVVFSPKTMGLDYTGTRFDSKTMHAVVSMAGKCTFSIFKNGVNCIVPLDVGCVSYVVVTRKEVMDGEIRRMTIGDILDEHKCELYATKSLLMSDEVRILDEKSNVRLVDTALGRLVTARDVALSRHGDLVAVIGRALKKRKRSMHSSNGPDPLPKTFRIKINSDPVYADPGFE